MELISDFIVNILNRLSMILNMGYLSSIILLSLILKVFFSPLQLVGKQNKKIKEQIHEEIKEIKNKKKILGGIMIEGS